MSVHREQVCRGAEEWKARAYENAADGLHLGRDDLAELGDLFAAVLAELKEDGADLAEIPASAPHEPATEQEES